MALRFLSGNPFNRAIRPPFIFHWKKPFFYLMASRPGQEREVHARVPIRPGYVFVKKGDPYVTRHCRQLTKSAGKDLFVVVDDKNRPLGLRVPASIHTAVLAADASTKTSRLAATAARDARALADARATLLRLFPAVPAGSVDRIVGHAFRKGSGRVGRTGGMSLEERVTLGVRAHVRHAHTAYDALMRAGMGRDEARRRVAETLEEVVRRWQGLPPEKSPRRMSFRNVGVGGNNEGCEDSKGGVRKPVTGSKRRVPSTPTRARKKAVGKSVKRTGAGARTSKQRGGKRSTIGQRKGGKKRS